MKSTLRVAMVSVLAAIPAAALATSVAPLTLDQMTDASDLVVRGTVESVVTEVEPSGFIQTVAEVHVTDALKGNVAADDYVTVVTPGGVLDDGTKGEIEGAPRFAKDEDTVLFLWARKDGETYGTVALSLGKYTVRPNPKDGTPIVVQFTVPVDRVYDPRFLPTPAADKRVSLDSLEEKVRSRVDLGWDGQAIPGVSLTHLHAINRLQPGVK